MAQSDKGILAAGVVLMDRGMDSSIDPRLLPENQSAFLINTTVRGGAPRNRPGWKKIPLTYESGIETAATTGRFQGASVFNPRTGLPMLVSSIGGRQFRYDVWGGETVQEITIASDRNPSNLTQAWWCQAEDWMILNDGLSAPFVWDGAGARRLGVQELPTGTVMEYALGRIWMASPDRRQFVASDLVGSSSGTASYNYRDAVLKFTENTFLNEGGSFSVPFTSGGINAIRAVANLDSSLGHGPIEVFTSNGAFSVNAPFDRTTWKDLTYPIQTVSMKSPGATSQYSIVNVNGDLWFRALDGIRSFVTARRDFTSWGNLPVSEEMTRLLSTDSPNLLGFASSALFDNRLLTTATPVWDQNQGVYHRALAVMDFDLISTIGARVGPTFQPAWDGMWTGLDIFQLVLSTYNGQSRCFAFTWSGTAIELYELLPNSNFDDDGTGPKRIQWALETKLFDFGTPNSLKQLERADIAPSNIEGEVDFEFKYKSDENPCWQDWCNANFRLCSTKSNCTPGGCWTPSLYQKSYRSRVTLPSPASDCLTGTCTTNRTPARQGTRQQARIKVTGACSIKQFVLYSRTMQEAPFNGCSPSTAVCTEDTCCPEEYYLESIT